MIRDIKDIIVLVVVGVIAYFWFGHIEQRCLYFPSKDFSNTPKMFGFAYEDIAFVTSDGVKLNAWFIPAPKIVSSAKTVLFSHGNGGNISHRIIKIEMFHSLGCNVLLYDYRGYGRSQGKPSERGLYKDAQAAYDYLIKERKIESESIIDYGESLGGAVAVDLASKNKVGALILEGTFSSAVDMSKEIFPFLPAFLIRSKFDSFAKIHSITVPKLFIHSLSDEIVPIALSKKLFNAAPEPKYYTVVEGGHNTSFIDSKGKFTESIAAFLGKLR